MWCRRNSIARTPLGRLVSGTAEPHAVVPGRPGVTIENLMIQNSGSTGAEGCSGGGVSSGAQVAQLIQTIPRFGTHRAPGRHTRRKA